MYRKMSHISSGVEQKKKSKPTTKSNNSSKQQNITSSTLPSYNNTITNNNHENIKMYVNNLYHNDSSSDFMQISPKSNSTQSCSGSSENLTLCQTNNESNVMGMNNYNSNITKTPPPGSYSLDFLHYVGVQITSGRNIPSFHQQTTKMKYEEETKAQNNTNTTVPVCTKSISSSNCNSGETPQIQHFYNEPSYNGNQHHNHYRYQHQNYHHNNNNYHMYNRSFNHQTQGKHNNNKNWNNNQSFHTTNNNNIGGHVGGGWSTNKTMGHKTFNNHKPNHNPHNNNNLNSQQINNYNKSNQNNCNRKPSGTKTTFTRSNRMVNSRSPTPSPKSESPPIDIVVPANVPLSPSIVNKTNNVQIFESTAIKTKEPNYVNNNNNTHHQQHHNGYDSDSSLSSFHRDALYFTTHHHGSTQLVEVPVNLHSIAEEPYRGYYTFYGSHQNLCSWNEIGMPHKSNYSSSSSDTGINFVTESIDLSDENCSKGNENVNKKRNTPGNTVITIASTKYKTGKKLQNLYAIRGPIEFTPADRLLSRAYTIQTKVAPPSLLIGSDWDSISRNMWQRFINAQQTEETFKKKMCLWRYLFLTIKKSFPKYGLYLVGSTITGLGTDNSDVDMCLVSRFVTNNDPRIEALFNLTELKNFLMNTSGIFQHFNLIQARVPILRFTDSLNCLEVDLNFNNCVGVRNTHLLYCYQQLDWRVKPLTVVVKLWAQHHHINNAKNMTISSYSLVLMVIHFLQCGVCPQILPCLHVLYPDKFQKLNELGSIDMNECVKPFLSKNRQTLGELFYQFLEYYSNFDYSQFAISIRTASVLPVETCRQAKSNKNDPHQWKQLCIEEPFDLTNTARSVYDGDIFERIKNVFVTSSKVLLDTMDLTSIFSTVFLTIQHPSGIPL